MTGAKIRVLAIDDNEKILQDYCKVLQRTPAKAGLVELESALFGEQAQSESQESRECVVDTASQGQEGVEMFRAAKLVEPYDIVFVDMRMPPGWNGLKTIKEIWKIDESQFVVLCSAYSDYTFHDLTRELGVRSNFLILNKPFDPAEILQIVQSVVARSTDHERHDKKLAWQLQKAIASNELSVAFQPIIDLSTGDLWAFETLCRWEQNGKTRSRPDEFIRVAEECGIIGELGQWVINSAMSCAAEFERAYDAPVRVTVNVSPLQLTPHFADQLTFLLALHGIAASSIGLEITESRLLQEGSDAEETISKLRELGFHILLDDFGSGFSNLLGLASTAFDTVKVDRMFCSNMHSRVSTIPIIKSVVDVAESMEKNCIVEGVEDLSQEESLRNMGCNLVQGYLYSPPISFSAALDWIDAELLAKQRKTA